MDVEDDDPIIEEMDIIYHKPEIPLSIMQAVNRPSDSVGRIAAFERVKRVLYKKMQNQLRITTEVNSNLKNINPDEANGPVGNEYLLRPIQNKTNYCVGYVKDNKLLLIPVHDTFQMRKTFAKNALISERKDVPLRKVKTEAPKKGNDTDEEMEEDSERKGQHKESLKQLESKLRSYTFQHAVFQSEEPTQYRFFDETSPESSLLLRALLEVPSKINSLHPLDKHRYSESLW